MLHMWNYAFEYEAGFGVSAHKPMIIKYDNKETVWSLYTF